MCGTWYTVEPALGWQITSLPLAGLGQAAEADSGAHSAAAVMRVIVSRCRDGYFMAMGPQGTGIFLQWWQCRKQFKRQVAALGNLIGRRAPGCSARARMGIWMLNQSSCRLAYIGN